jgi:hypothetical protein
LLGYYYNLDVDKVCSEDTIKAINLTKIVEKDYSKNILKWNIPLFQGQQTEWDWVEKYNDMWNINKARKDSLADVVKRMQEWFKKYPHYRRQDVQAATQAYFKTVKDPQYLKSSAKFIFEGVGATKMSHLLKWCEQTAGQQGNNSNIKGKVL